MEVKGHKECFLHAERRQPILSKKEEKTEKKSMLTRYTNSASVRIHNSIVFNTVINICFSCLHLSCKFGLFWVNLFNFT